MRYIKDEKRLNEYLIQRALDSLTVRGAKGEEVKDANFAEFVKDLLSYRDRLGLLGDARTGAS